MPISSADLAGIRTTVNSFLPDLATITRTSIVAPCEVRDAQRDIHVDGLTDLLRLRRQELLFPDATDVGAGDSLTIAGKGWFFVLASTDHSSLSAENLCYAVSIGTPVIASTTRMQGAKAQGQTSQYVAHLASLSLVSLAGVLFRPLADQEEADSFGVSLSQAQKVMALWPTGATETFPVRVGDGLVLVDGTLYRVKGIRNYPGKYIDIVVEVPTTQA